jgi:repressor LexA
MLTKKQHELLEFICSWSRKSSVAPSFDEMKQALHLKSKSGIHRLITGLEERGFIRRLAHRARAIEVLRLPDGSRVDNAMPTPEPAWQGQAEIVAGPFGGGLTPRTVAGGAPVLRGRATPRRDETSIALPVRGKIAAGTPIDALSNPHRSWMSRCRCWGAVSIMR